MYNFQDASQSGFEFLGGSNDRRETEQKARAIGATLEALFLLPPFAASLNR
jgi:hypothetical protein